MSTQRVECGVVVAPTARGHPIDTVTFAFSEVAPSPNVSSLSASVSSTLFLYRCRSVTLERVLYKRTFAQCLPDCSLFREANSKVVPLFSMCTFILFFLKHARQWHLRQSVLGGGQVLRPRPQALHTTRRQLHLSSQVKRKQTQRLSSFVD